MYPTEQFVKSLGLTLLLIVAISHLNALVHIKAPLLALLLVCTGQVMFIGALAFGIKTPFERNDNWWRGLSYRSDHGELTPSDRQALIMVWFFVVGSLLIATGSIYAIW